MRTAALLIVLLAALAPDARAQRVRKVIDGDTITVSRVGVVRLIGVDAPEKQSVYRDAEPFGKRATAFMRTLVEGRMVRLEYDGARKDPYDRTLAYVYLGDGTLANEAIIRAGLAEVYRRFQFKLKARFFAAEREARRAHRGMWAARRRLLADPANAALPLTVECTASLSLCCLAPPPAGHSP